MSVKDSAALLDRREIDIQKSRANLATVSGYCVAILSAEPKASGFVPLTVSPGAPVAPITLELQRRGACIKVSWPIEAAEHCASMLRELLR
jgi:hypothetical protein